MSPNPTKEMQPMSNVRKLAGLRGPNAVDGLRGPNAVDGLRGPNAYVNQ